LAAAVLDRSSFRAFPRDRTDDSSRVRDVFGVAAQRAAQEPMSAAPLGSPGRVR
jgi:hypothetical protein